MIASVSLEADWELSEGGNWMPRFGRTGERLH